MFGYFAAVPLYRRLTIVRAVSIGYSIVPGMRVDNRVPAVQLFVDRPEFGIAEILVSVKRLAAPVRVHVNAVGFERVQSVFDLLQAAVDIGKREHGKHSQAARMTGNHFRGVVVDFACEPSRFSEISVPDPRADGRT